MIRSYRIIIGLSLQWCCVLRTTEHIIGLVQNCDISSALEMEIPKFCDKPSNAILKKRQSHWVL